MKLNTKILLFVVLLVCDINSVKAQENLEKRPNVIIIMTDDQGYGDLACHGNMILDTPNMDRLHSESVRFTNFHVSPTCAPTRAALMTGLYTNRTGVWHTIGGRSLLRKDKLTIADVFKENEYHTAIFGKWHLGDNYPSRPQDRGFQEVLIHGSGGVGQTPDFFDNDYYDDTYIHNGKLEEYKGYCTDIWFEEAAALGAKFDKIRTCNTQTIFAAQVIRQSSPDEDSEGVMMVSNCSVSEGITPVDLAMADAKWNAYLDSNEGKGSIFRWYPAVGDSIEADYDFKNVFTASSMNEWGDGMGSIINEGGLLAQLEIYGEMLSCDSPRLYQINNVRSPSN